MINFRRASWVALGLVLTASFQFVNADETSIRMIVLTDHAEKSGAATSGIGRSSQPGHRHAARQQILKDIERQRLEMEVNGFVVGTDALISGKDNYPEELMKHQAITGNTYDSVLPNFGYSARNLNDTPFSDARLLGFMPLRSEDDKIHEAVWAYAVPGIGNVVVEELSYQTIPGVTIKVAEPSGNIQINGNPGTYMVMTDEAGKRGITTIDFMTSDKLFAITAYEAVKRDDKRFKRLFELAESLY